MNLLQSIGKIPNQSYENLLLRTPVCGCNLFWCLHFVYNWGHDLFFLFRIGLNIRLFCIETFFLKSYAFLWFLLFVLSMMSVSAMINIECLRPCFPVIKPNKHDNSCPFFCDCWYGIFIVIPIEMIVKFKKNVDFESIWMTATYPKIWNAKEKRFTPWIKRYSLIKITSRQTCHIFNRNNNLFDTHQYKFQKFLMETTCFWPLSFYDFMFMVNVE